VREGPVEVLRTSRLNNLKLHPQCPCRDFRFLQRVLFRAFAEGAWMPEHCYTGDSRNYLLEQFQTLADYLRSEVGQPRDIAPRPRKVGDEPFRNWIGSDSEDNGEGPGGLLGGQGGDCACGHDDINFQRNQFAPESGEPFDLPLRISVFDHDVATLDVTEVTQSLTEGIAPLRVTGQVGRQVAYSSDLGRLLSLRSERRKSEAESENDREPDQRHGHLGGEWLAGV